jgi:hypothetical protein
MIDPPTTALSRPCRPARYFASYAEIALLVGRFERATLPRECWDHRARLAVVLWYLVHERDARTTERLGTSIRRYNARQAPDRSYHETLTRFWVAVVRLFLNRAGSLASPRDVTAVANTLLDRYGDRGDLVFQHYHRSTIGSPQARCSWVEPDRLPLAG